MNIWTQNYNPLGHAWLSTIVAALPVVVLFYLLAVRRMIAHRAAVWAFLLAAVLAVAVFGMPAPMAGAAATQGFIYAAVRIIWTLIAAVFIYELTVESGHFEIIKESIGGITADRRLQVLLIAFAFGAMLEGAGGGGAPVAIAGAMMVGLGFRPMDAAVLCLIANTAPVAFGGLGNPVRVLVAVTGLPEGDLSATIGRILPWTALILPFWLIRSMTNWRNTFSAWPGLAACGAIFAACQFYWSNYRDPSLVDVIGGAVTLIFLAAFFRVWRPATPWRYPGEASADTARLYPWTTVAHAWSPYIILTALVIAWGLPPVKRLLDPTTLSAPMPWLHQLIRRVPPVVAETHLEPAMIDFAWLSAVGTATFIAGLIAGPVLGLSFGKTLRVFARTCHRMRYSALAIFAMLGLGFITRYSGMDAVMGLAMTHTGSWFPFFGTMLGWLGVALTGTDAGSNALFGSLQVITANNLGLNPTLMAAANSAGGVMGKMIDAQSIIVACAAVGLEGEEGNLFRAVLPHSIALAALVGLIVYLYAYYFQAWIPSGVIFR